MYLQKIQYFILKIINIKIKLDDFEDIKMKKIIIGISGADGVCLGVRLLELLKSVDNVETHLVMTKAAEKNLSLEGFDLNKVLKLADYVYPKDDMAAKISSGSFVINASIPPCGIENGLWLKSTVPSSDNSYIGKSTIQQIATLFVSIA